MSLFEVDRQEHVSIQRSNGSDEYDAIIDFDELGEFPDGRWNAL